MAFQEITEQQWLSESKAEEEREALFFFTPLCGTCKLALRMLEIAEAAGIAVPVRTMNINFAPALRERWRISSVPCLALLEGGQPVRFEYAMRSVDDLYRLLQ
ncbi:thioredoxin family protein [Paenibacillus silvisoli]|uniref:thioredoxin family protein n=1 Tax=Paenibacillus silvisoli TaxID=3110539 RepID=UPI0028057674|nr:thioredoxin family protein [Paenibacillus silvisoli]